LGAVVDRYTLVRVLGFGGMGAVYEARHATLSRRFAIKFLLPELSANREVLRRTGPSEQSERRPNKRTPARAARVAAPPSAVAAPNPAPPAASPPARRPVDIEKDNPYGP
jgi:serine/threonine protein kinase